MARLLIVDGDPVVREVLARLLAQAGREISTAASADEALEIAGRLLPEVALIDKSLPHASGIDLSRRLKELQPEIEIIVTAGFASLETAIEAMRLGAFDYLTKPIEDYPAFATRVQTAVERSALRRSQRALLERLMQSELRHRRLLEAMPDALIVHDRGGRVVDANPAAVRLYGHELHELVRLRVDALGGAAAGRQRHLRKDGTAIDVEVSTTEYIENGELLRVMTVRQGTCEPTSNGCRNER
jgi:FixJ family two-component response regulator